MTQWRGWISHTAPHGKRQVSVGTRTWARSGRDPLGASADFQGAVRVFGRSDGGWSYGDLAPDAQGDLYGTTGLWRLHSMP
jgi:hypothetical protein